MKGFQQFCKVEDIWNGKPLDETSGLRPQTKTLCMSTLDGEIYVRNEYI